LALVPPLLLLLLLLLELLLELLELLARLVRPLPLRPESVAGFHACRPAAVSSSAVLGASAGSASASASSTAARSCCSTEGEAVLGTLTHDTAAPKPATGGGVPVGPTSVVERAQHTLLSHQKPPHSSQPPQLALADEAGVTSGRTRH
jgi:hypothetical protein